MLAEQSLLVDSLKEENVKSLEECSPTQRVQVYQKTVRALRRQLGGDNTRMTPRALNVFINDLAMILQDLDLHDGEGLESRDGFEAYIEQAKGWLESAFDRINDSKKGRAFYNDLIQARKQLKNALDQV